MSDNILNAYIDEAGDEGFQTGASQWFIISSVVVKDSNDRDIARVINDIKSRLWGNVTRQPLHWTRLRHDKKRVVIQEISKHDFTLFAVALEKKYLARERFDSHYDRENRMKFRWAMYFYATKLLVERVCKYAERQDAQVNLIFENRSSISYRDLRDYLTFMADYPGPYGRTPTIPRKMIKSVEPHNKEVKKLLQVADACSGALKDALEINQYGDVEESYIMGLADKFDRPAGRLWGIGLKLFPRSLKAVQDEYKCYSWMAKI
jgi:hypothetical protein